MKIGEDARTIALAGAAGFRNFIDSASFRSYVEADVL